MGKLNKILAAGVLSVLFFGQAAKSMQIPQYDKMDLRDQSNYDVLLLKGAYDDLTARGQTEQAEKLISFFQDKTDNGGFKQLDKNLQLVRDVNKKNAADPNYKKPPYEVEHAMALTLKNDGILVSVSTLLAAGKNFTPKYPLSGNSTTQR